jgi:ribonuclease D
VIYDWMKARLEKTGRASWVAEDVAALQDPALYRIEPEQCWKRLKPRTTNKRFLAVLASLAPGGNAKPRRATFRAAGC